MSTSGPPTDPASVPKWALIIPDEEREVYRLAGYGSRSELGLSPVLLVVDTTINFTGDRAVPIAESIKKWPNSCGVLAWFSISSIVSLIEAARVGERPIVFTRGPLKKNALTLGGWNRTQQGLAFTEDDPGEQFPAPIQVKDGDVVLEKLRPSAFFGTPLSSMLMELRADTVVICGGTTSGCVRATAVDAFSQGLSVCVVEEATFDRGLTSRAVSLFDMSQKYASVQSLVEVARYLSQGRS
jgi:maleamate amidohydrolase